MAAFDDDLYADALRRLPPGDLPARNDVIDLPGGARPVSVGRLLDKLRNRGRPAVNANLRDALELHGLFLEAHPTKDEWVRLPNIRPRHGGWTDDDFAKALEAREPGDLPGTDFRDPLPAGHDRQGDVPLGMMLYDLHRKGRTRELSAGLASQLERHGLHVETDPDLPGRIRLEKPAVPRSRHR